MQRKYVSVGAAGAHHFSIKLASTGRTFLLDKLFQIVHMHTWLVQNMLILLNTFTVPFPVNCMELPLLLKIHEDHGL